MPRLDACSNLQEGFPFRPLHEIVIEDPSHKHRDVQNEIDDYLLKSTDGISIGNEQSLRRQFPLLIWGRLI